MAPPRSCERTRWLMVALSQNETCCATGKKRQAQVNAKSHPLQNEPQFLCFCGTSLSLVAPHWLRIGMDIPASPKASVVVSYQHCPACWVQQLGQTGFCFTRAGFGFVRPGSARALGSRHPTWTGSAKSL